MAQTLRDYCHSRLEDLKKIRTSWEPTWRDIAEQLLPYRVRFRPSDWNRGNIGNNAMLDNTPALAVRVMSSGMMAGITSPSRKWFRLTTSDPDLAKWAPAKRWLSDCEDLLRWGFARSTWYSELADGLYRDLIFGTALMMSEEDDETAVYWTSRPIGEYWLDTNSRNVVDTVYRQFRMTVRQVVQEHGLERVSPLVRNLWDRSQYGQNIQVIHAVFPQTDQSPERSEQDRGARMGVDPGHKFRSVWFEEDAKKELVLRDSGFYEAPHLAPRWNVNGGEVYGRGPGWEALGPAKGMQFLEERHLTLVDKMGDPPMVGPESMRGQRASLLPGDMTYEPNGAGASAGFRPAIQIVPGAIEATRESKEEHRNQIDRALFVDLWMRLIQDDRLQRATATEVEEVKQETMLQLGPVLENLNNGLYQPAIARHFAALKRRGVIPPPPRELMGQSVQVEFISIMHQMQKMTGLSGIRTLVDETGRLAQLEGTGQLVVDKINIDAVVDDLAEMTGVRPQLIRSTDEVEGLRQARAQQEHQKQAMEQALQASQVAKNANGVSPDTMQSVAQVAQSLSPVAAAQGGGQPGGGM